MRTEFPRPRHTIDGVTYEFEMLPVAQGLRMSVRIVGALATSASKVFSSFEDGKSFFDQKLEGAALSDAVIMLVGKLTEDEIESSIAQLMNKTFVVQGQKVTPVNMDLQFTGKITHMYKVAWKTLEVNFSDFLGATIGSRIKEAVQSMIQEKPT